MTKAERAHLVRWARAALLFAEQDGEAFAKKTGDRRDAKPYQLGHLQASLKIFAEALEHNGLPLVREFVGPIHQQQPAPALSPMAQSCIDAVGGTIARAVGHDRPPMHSAPPEKWAPEDRPPMHRAAHEAD